eukprot:TRINITY_DN941_c0_g1_i6.p1 TRINITY_DN941_c0_g1~~TRINITY_DN941_c0_g1_i6.p1  ORF type:complete len:201 (-),score=-1.51 TRINITY_DN941_c0_g1_i6:6-608(-)
MNSTQPRIQWMMAFTAPLSLWPLGFTDEQNQNHRRRINHCFTRLRYFYGWHCRQFQSQVAKWPNLSFQESVKEEPKYALAESRLKVAFVNFAAKNTEPKRHQYLILLHCTFPYRHHVSTSSQSMTVSEPTMTHGIHGWKVQTSLDHRSEYSTVSGDSLDAFGRTLLHSLSAYPIFYRGGQTLGGNNHMMAPQSQVHAVRP